MDIEHDCLNDGFSTEEDDYEELSIDDTKYEEDDLELLYEEDDFEK